MESSRVDAATSAKLTRLREKVREARFSGGVASEVGKDIYSRSAKSGKGWLSRFGRWLYKLNPNFMNRMY